MSNVKRFFADEIENQALQDDSLNTQGTEESPSDLAALLGTDDETATRVLMLIDSTEEFKDYSRQVDALLPMLGVEGFSEVAKQLFDAIINWLKVVASALVDEMAAHEMVARTISFKAANLKASSRDRSLNAGNREPLVIQTRIQNLCSNYKPAKDVAQLISGLRYLKSVAELYYGYVDGVVNAAGQMTGSARANANAEQLAQQMERLSPTNMTRSSLIGPGEADGVHMSFHLMGGYRLVIDTKTGYDTAERIKSTKVRLKTSSPIPLPLPAKIEIPRFNLGTSDTCLDTIVNVADYLQSVNTMSTRARRQSKIRDITMTLEALRRVMEANPNDPANMSRLKEVAELLETLADWIFNPYIGLYSLACRDLRAALNVCELNAS